MLRADNLQFGRHVVFVRRANSTAARHELYGERRQLGDGVDRRLLRHLVRLLSAIRALLGAASAGHRG